MERGVMVAMTAGRLRTAQRGAHLLAAAILLGYVYPPLDTQLEGFIRIAALPMLGLSGIAMWQAARTAAH